MKWIVRLYILFVGIILTTTVGFGIAAFYPQPVRPSYPNPTYTQPIPESCSSTPQAQSTPECQKLFTQQKSMQASDQQAMRNYDQKIQEFNNVNAGYTRTAIFLGIAIGAFFAILGLALIKLSHPVSNGIMLAGVLTAVSTRIIIILASLGSSVSSTSGADQLAYIEFGILVLLSLAVIVLGFTTLRALEGKK